MTAADTIITARNILDKLTYIPCESRIYTLDDDQFSDICFARDLLDSVISEMKMKFIETGDQLRRSSEVPEKTIPKETD